MAGEEDRHQLVAQILVGEPGTTLVTCLHQHREQIPMVGCHAVDRLAAPRRNDLLDHRSECALGFMLPPVARRWDPAWRWCFREDIGLLDEQFVYGIRVADQSERQVKDAEPRGIAVVTRKPGKKS